MRSAESKDLQLQRIAESIRRQDLPDAEARCRGLLLHDERIAEAWALLAEIARLCGRWPDAESCLANALTLEPGQPRYRLALAELYQQSGQDERALPLLESLAARHADPAVLLSQGRVCWRLGRYPDGLRAFERAAAQQPDQEPLVLPLVRALCALGRLSDASARLRDLLDSGRQSGEAALLEVHLRLTERGIASSLQAAETWARRYPDHQGLARLVEALRAIEGRPDAQLGILSEAQRQSLEYLLPHRDGLLWLGLPVEVLHRAMRQAPAHGLWLEAGVYFGRSIAILAADTTRQVHGFDSFQGLPEDWKAGEGRGSYSTGGRLPPVPANVSLHTGWFEQTLPSFLQAHDGPVSLLHVDCDLYSSTRSVLACLAGRFQPGTVIVFDDFLGYPGFADHELKAFREFVAESGWSYRILAASVLGREVAIELVGAATAAYAVEPSLP